MKTFKEYLSEDTKFHKYSKNTLEELELLLKHHKEDLEEYDEEGECNRDEILKDIEEIEDAIASKSTNEAINKANWDGLKSFMKKQPGFSSWEFEGDYEELVIGFKKNIQAIKAFKASNASYIEVSAFGQSSAGNSEIRVELSKEAMKAMEVNEEIITEGAIDDSFVNYFNSFYGMNDPVYPKANKTGKDFTKEQLEKALKLRDKERKFEFVGDTVDRETLGSILIELKLMNSKY